VDSSQEGAVARVTALIPVHIESMSVTDATKPFVHGFGESFVLGVLPLPADSAQPESEMLICAVGRNWLVTVHDGEAGALIGFADHLRGDSVLGRLDAPSFLARLLEWVVNAYLDYLDEVHDVIDGGHDVVHKMREGGMSHRRMQTRAEDSWERNADAVAAELDRVVATREPELVLITGDVRAVALVRDGVGQRAAELLVEVPGGSRAQGMKRRYRR